MQNELECGTVEHNIDGGGTIKRTPERPERLLMTVLETLSINATEQ